jgi:hypothetical protein
MLQRRVSFGFRTRRQGRRRDPGARSRHDVRCRLRLLGQAPSARQKSRTRRTCRTTEEGEIWPRRWSKAGRASSACKFTAASAPHCPPSPGPPFYSKTRPPFKKLFPRSVRAHSPWLEWAIASELARHDEPSRCVKLHSGEGLSAYSCEVASARAANSVFTSPLWGGSAHAGKLAQSVQAWLRCAGVGVVVVARDASTDSDPHPLPTRGRGADRVRGVIVPPARTQ